jgi:hypothetical protein
MTLSYKDTQAFVGQDGKPSAPVLTSTTPNLVIKPNKGKNTSLIGNVYGHGSSLQTALNLSDVPDPTVAVANLGLNPGIEELLASDIAGGQRSTQAHESRFDHLLLRSLIDILILETANGRRMAQMHETQFNHNKQVDVLAIEVFT